MPERPHAQLTNAVNRTLNLFLHPLAFPQRQITQICRWNRGHAVDLRYVNDFVKGTSTMPEKVKQDLGML